jgi:hypothetical protein
MTTRSTIRAEYIVSDKDSHFTGGLAQNAGEAESINFPADWRTIGVNQCVIESITIQSDQNLEWDIYLWSGAEADNTDLDTDTFIDYFNYATTTGKQIAGANQYYYASPSNNLNIAYKDDDNSGKLHVTLVNRSATAKNAGGTGEVKLQFIVRPVFGV